MTLDELAELDPILNNLTMIDGEPTLRIGYLGVKQLCALHGLLGPVEKRSIRHALDKLWTTYSGTSVPALLGTIAIDWFSITVSDNKLQMLLKLDNMGTMRLSAPLTGKASRLYLYRTLESIHSAFFKTDRISHDILVTYVDDIIETKIIEKDTFSLYD